MFSFGQKNKQVEVRDLLRRITDLSTPNLSPMEGEARSDNRYNRTFPVLLAPMIDGQIVVDEATSALTKDFSDRGIALVLHQPLHAETVLVGLVLTHERDDLETLQTHYASGTVRQSVPLGGGFWQLGVELSALVDPERLEHFDELLPAMRRLVPSHLQASLPSFAASH
jgi:hypothetical protein